MDRSDLPDRLKKYQTDKGDIPDRLKKYQTDRGESSGSGGKASEAEESFDKAMKNLSGRMDRRK